MVGVHGLLRIPSLFHAHVKPAWLEPKRRLSLRARLTMAVAAAYGHKVPQMVAPPGIFRAEYRRQVMKSHIPKSLLPHKGHAYSGVKNSLMVHGCGAVMFREVIAEEAVSWL